MPNRPALYRPYNIPAAPRVRQPDRRATAPERGYDTAWGKLRAWWINRNPMCAWPGCQQPGAIVDHIEPVRVAPARRLDLDNLQTLCRSHHGVKTARDLRKEGR